MTHGEPRDDLDTFAAAVARLLLSAAEDQAPGWRRPGNDVIDAYVRGVATPTQRRQMREAMHGDPAFQGEILALIQVHDDADGSDLAARMSAVTVPLAELVERAAGPAPRRGTARPGRWLRFALPAFAVAAGMAIAVLSHDLLPNDLAFLRHGSRAPLVRVVPHLVLRGEHILPSMIHLPSPARLVDLAPAASGDLVVDAPYTAMLGASDPDTVLVRVARQTRWVRQSDGAKVPVLRVPSRMLRPGRRYTLSFMSLDGADRPDSTLAAVTAFAVARPVR